MIAFTRPDGSWTTLMMPLVTRTSQPGGRRSAKPTQSSTCWTTSVKRGAGPRSNGVVVQRPREAGGIWSLVGGHHKLGDRPRRAVGR